MIIMRKIRNLLREKETDYMSDEWKISTGHSQTQLKRHQFGRCYVANQLSFFEQFPFITKR